MKKIGFLSFGHWMDQGSLVKTAQDAYLQSIDLAVEAEKNWNRRSIFPRTSFCPSDWAAVSFASGNRRKDE